MSDYLDAYDPILGIIGPSGSGKSSLVRFLAQTGIIAVTPTWTTRPPRSDELGQPTEHCFVTEEEYISLEQSGYFISSVQLFGLEYKYGLPRVQKPPSGQVATVMLRAMVLAEAKRLYPNILIYQIEDQLSRVRSRLKKREAKGEVTGTRLLHYQQEVLAGRELSQRVFCNDGSIEQLANDIKSAINSDFPARQV